MTHWTWICRAGAYMDPSALCPFKCLQCGTILFKQLNEKHGLRQRYKSFFHKYFLIPGCDRAMVTQNLWEWPTTVWFDVNPLYETKPILDTAWITKYQKLEIQESMVKTEYYCCIKCTNKIITSGILLHSQISAIFNHQQRGFFQKHMETDAEQYSQTLYRKIV